MSQQPVVISSEVLPASEARWITLNKLKWKDANGEERTWESASRKTQGPTGIDAVVILAVITSESNAFRPSTIIIEQFRPPIGKFLVELPAGLIDHDESPETAAIRELEEETGFKATESDIIQTSYIQAADPGLSSATMKLITIKVTIPGDQKEVPNPPQKLDSGEFIVKRVVEIEKMVDILTEYSKQGYVIDSRLAAFASGYQLSKQLGTI